MPMTTREPHQRRKRLLKAKLFDPPCSTGKTSLAMQN